MIDRKRNVDLDITGINGIWFDEVSGKVSHFKKVPHTTYQQHKYIEIW